MNADRLRKIADVIEERPDQFDMSEWMQGPEYIRAAGDDYRYGWIDLSAVTQVDLLAAECGTSACIAGWAVALWPSEVENNTLNDDDVEDAAAQILGLTAAVAEDLFYRTPDDPCLAAARLRVLAAIADQDGAG